MRYIDALKLIQLCIASGILKTKNDGILVYRAKGVSSPEGWYVVKPEDLAQELMRSEEGQKALTEALKKDDIIFAKLLFPGTF